MRTLLLTLISSVFCVNICLARNKFARLQVTLDDNLQSSTVYIKELDLWFLTPAIVDSLISKNNRIEFEFLDDSNYRYLQIENFSIMLFPDPKQKIEMHFTKDSSGKINYSSNQKNMFDYWDSYQTKYLRNGGFNDEYRNSVKLDFEEFLVYQENHFNKRKNEVDSVCALNDFPESFCNYLIGNMVYEHEEKILDYFEHHYYYLTVKESTEYYWMDEVYYNRFSSFLTYDHDIKSWNFYSFLGSYIDDQYYRAFERKDSVLEDLGEFEYKFNFAKNKLSGKVRDLAICIILRTHVNRISDFESYTSCGEMIEEFDKICIDRKYFDHVKNFYDKEALLSLIPEFCLLNTNGESQCLSNWKGKQVVLYFTGINCIPCKKEQPIIETIAAEYSDIVFLSVSLEHNAFAYWKESIKPNTNLIHLYAEKGWSNSELSEFHMQAIPRFILLNADGEIVNAHASNPSQNLSGDIQKYLLNRGH